MKSEQKFQIVPIMILILQIITHEIKKKKNKKIKHMREQMPKRTK